MKVHALILAGGAGSRLGYVRKADIRLGGRTMLDRVTSVLTGRVDAFMPTLPDPVGTAGPIAGLAAAVIHLRDSAAPEDAMICVAVDTPFLPADYAPRLLAALSHSPAAYAGWGDSFYPTNAAFRLDAIFDLPERAATLGSPRRLLQSLGAIVVDWSASEPDNPFANLNTLADLVTLSRRAE